MSANDPSRKRIVIHLDQPVRSGGGVPGNGRRNSVPRKARRWPKVVATLLVLVIIGLLGLGAGGFFWWRHYQTTPAYSLALMIDAAQRDDLVAFGQLLDDDAVARNLVLEVSRKAASRYGIALNASLERRINAMVPGLIASLKDKIHQELAKNIKDIAAKSAPRPFILLALAVPKFATIKTEGDTARATAQATDRPIELGLKQSGERWKVTEIRDDVFIQHVVDGMMKDLPAIGELDLGPLLLKPKPGPRKRRGR